MGSRRERNPDPRPTTDRHFTRDFKRLGHGFISDVLQIDWAMLSPNSRLSDFESLSPPSVLATRILDTYAVDISTLPDDRMSTIFAAIAAAHPRPSRASVQRALREVLNEHDVMGLIAMGTPDDEYDPEINAILTALRTSGSPSDVAAKLPKIFWCMFGGKDAVTFNRWSDLAEDLWNAFEPFRHS